MNELRRSDRSKKPKRIFEQSPIAQQRPESKTSKKSTSKRLKTRPAPLKDASAASAVKSLIDQPLPQFSPPMRVPFRPFTIRWIEQDPFSLFVKFLGELSLIAIVDATNARAAH